MLPVSPREAKAYLQSASGDGLQKTLLKIANGVLAQQAASGLVLSGGSGAAAPASYDLQIAQALRQSGAISLGVLSVSTLLLPRPHCCACVQASVRTALGCTGAAVAVEAPWTPEAAEGVAALGSAASVALKGLDPRQQVECDGMLCNALECCTAPRAVGAAAHAGALRLALSIALARAGALLAGVALQAHLRGVCAGAERAESGGSATARRGGGGGLSSPLTSPARDAEEGAMRGDGSTSTSTSSVATTTFTTTSGGSGSGAALATLGLGYYILQGGLGACAFPFRGLALWLPPTLPAAAGPSSPHAAICRGLCLAQDLARGLGKLVGASPDAVSPVGTLVPLTPSFTDASGPNERYVAVAAIMSKAVEALGHSLAAAAAAAGDGALPAQQQPSLFWSVGAQDMCISQAELEKEREAAEAAAAAAAATAAAAAAPPAKGGKPPPPAAAPPAAAAPAAKGGKGGGAAAAAAAAPPPPLPPDERILWATEPNALLPSAHTTAASTAPCALYDFSRDRAHWVAPPPPHPHHQWTQRQRRPHPRPPRPAHPPEFPCPLPSLRTT